MDTFSKMIDEIRGQIKELEEQLDRANDQGIPVFQLAKALGEKRSELKVLERVSNMPELPF